MSEIYRQLEDVPNAILMRHRSLSASVWLGALILVPIFLMSGDGILRFLAFLAPLCALVFSLVQPHDLRELREKPALVAWRSWFDEWGQNRVKTAHASRELGRKILEIYEREPTGRLFPLEQSARLFETYLRQQVRLRELENQLHSFGKNREELRAKLDELQTLGQTSPSGQGTFEQVEGDYVTLERAKNEISASCRRLELLVMSIENTARGDALREKTGIGATPSNAVPQADTEFLMPTDEAEIERQLTHEMETYAKLERETQAQLG